MVDVALVALNHAANQNAALSPVVSQSAAQNLAANQSAALSLAASLDVAAAHHVVSTTEMAMGTTMDMRKTTTGNATAVATAADVNWL